MRVPLCQRLVVVFFLLFSFSSYAQLEKMVFQHKSLENGSSVRLFVHIELPFVNLNNYTPSNFIESYKVSYKLFQNYTDNIPLASKEVSLSVQNVVKDSLGVQLVFDVAKTNNPTAVLFLDVRNIKSNEINTQAIDLYFAKTKIGEEYAVFNKNDDFPNLHNYLTAGSTFKIKNLQNTTKQLYVSRFKGFFGAAPAPMLLNRGNSEPLSIDSSFVVQSSQAIVWNQEGLYLIREDTTSFYGIGLQIVPKGYPKLTEKEQLVAPLTYISTVEELYKLQNSSNVKKELDRFWLRLMKGNVDLAKKTIKNYYRRIKESNLRYSSFKAGWKTDMGMIYIIYGYPDEVRFGKDVIQWTYIGGEKSFTKASFTFRRRANQFTNDYYTLVRYVEYEPIWYPSVELWRKGVATL